MNEKDMFPDYEPKITPDTVHDYLRKPESIVFEILAEIGQPSLKNLKKIINYFKKYRKAALKNPGGYQRGNVAIGADLEQYYPSEEEILASELGKMIRDIIDSNSKEEIEKIKKEDKIASQTLTYKEIYYRHVDVMGSGRFFYAEKKETESKLKI